MSSGSGEKFFQRKNLYEIGLLGENGAKFEEVAQPINKGIVITVQTSMAISLILLICFQRTFSSMKVRIQKWICLI